MTERDAGPVVSDLLEDCVAIEPGQRRHEGAQQLAMDGVQIDGVADDQPFRTGVDVDGCLASARNDGR